MKKVFAFRFDIDTPKCLGEGVPALIDLADRLGVRFTFFLNVGRAVSIAGFVRRKLNGRSSELVAPSLSARAKLGNLGYIYTAFMNPNIGPKFPEIVKKLSRSQDLGLHGGRNHDLWHHGVKSWTAEQTRSDIRWAVDWLREINVAVEGFSAPAWSEREDLPEILLDLGFKFRADRHGVDATWGKVERSLLNIGTNLTGEPGGVAYLEHQRALGRTEREILADFDLRLDSSPDYAVVYDHPYFAGVRDLALVEKLVRRAMERGYQVITLSDIAKLLRERQAS